MNIIDDQNDINLPFNNDISEVKVVNTQRKVFLYISFFLFILSLSSFIGHIVVSEIFTTIIITNYAFSIWWSFFNLIVTSYLYYDVLFRFDHETQSFIALKYQFRIFRTIKFVIIGLVSLTSSVACFLISEIAGVWALFITLSSCLIVIISFLKSEGEGDSNPFEGIKNSCIRFMFLWVCYGVFWFLFIVLFCLAAINSIRISSEVIFKYPAPGKYNHNIHAHCIGSGAPSVILLGGGSVPSFVWKDTQELISKFTTACLYDRAGYGWSFNGNSIYTPDQVVTDMFNTMNVLSIPSPFIIVPHSVAGIYAWAFAKKYPDKTAGLIMVDAQNNFSWNKECPQTSTFTTKLIRGLDPIGMVNFFASSSLFPEMQDMSKTYKDEFISYISNGRHSEADYQMELYKSESCKQNFDNIINENLNELPIIAISAGYSLNATCASNYITNEFGCENHLSITQKIAPKMALQGLTESKATTNGKWKICSTCLHEVFIDSPEIISESAKDIIDFLKTKQKFDDKIEISCRTRRKNSDFNWCFEALCDWCEDRDSCLKLDSKDGKRYCKSLNKLIFPDEKCTNGLPPKKETCFDESCVKDECINKFYPIDLKKGGVCPKNSKCIN